ncbi:MAG: class I SAM-dependent methyltransferase [Halobacteriales archaeon]
MPTWDERFRRGSYPRDPDPSPVLRHYVDGFPDGPALDVATGTGRNALFLAESGHAVDAIDQSREGLRIARASAADRGVADRVNWIQADVSSFGFPERRYAAITISYYRAIDRLTDLKEALAPGGYLFYEHHLRSSEPTPSGPSSDRYRFAANELLHANLDLTVLYYDETTSENPDGERRANVRLLARRSSGTRQRYPRRWDR